MIQYIVSPTEAGWKIEGIKGQGIYKNKSNAVRIARKYARRRNAPLIVYSKDGNISSVTPYTKRSEKVMQANVKRKLNNHRVRVSIAKVIHDKNELESI